MAASGWLPLSSSAPSKLAGRRARSPKQPGQERNSTPKPICLPAIRGPLFCIPLAPFTSDTRVTKNHFDPLCPSTLEQCRPTCPRADGPVPANLSKPARANGAARASQSLLGQGQPGPVSPSQQASAIRPRPINLLPAIRNFIFCIK